MKNIKGSRTEYLDHRRMLFADKNEFSRFFDRTFIYLVTAVLAFSIHFVYSNKMPLGPLIFISWGLLFVSVIAFIIEYKFLILSYDKQLNILDKCEAEGKDDADIRNPYILVVDISDWSAVLGFCAGFCLLFIFFLSVYLDP